MFHHTRIVFLALLCGISAFPLSSQAGSSYMANGLGYEWGVENSPSRGMGGAGVARLDEYNIMSSNPALLSGIVGYNFFFGMTNPYTKTSIQGAGTDVAGKTDQDILMFALPVRKGVTFGWKLAPLTTTDASLSVNNVQNGIRMNDIIDVTGGLNTSYTTIAVSIRNWVRLGYSMNYHFGMIEEQHQRNFPDNAELLTSTYYLKRKYSGYSNSVGAITSIGRYLSIGVGYRTGSTMDNRDYVVMGALTNPDKVLSTGKVKLPASLTAGVFVIPNPKVGLAVDAAWEKWKDAAVTAQEKAQYNDTFRISAGVRCLPSSRESDPYYLKIPVTAGMQYRTLYFKSYPVVDVVSEMKLTLGAEFPLKNNFGILATSVEAGTRGKQKTNGFHEMFLGFNIALIGSIR